MYQLLPLDLVHSIAEHLHDDTYTLASLCLLDKEAVGSMIPLLYKKFYLSSVRAISQFCDAVLESKHNLGIYPISIHFTPEDHADEQLYSIINSPQSILIQVPNLTDLVLGIDTPNLIDLHRYLQLHPPSFSLHSLACHFTPHLMSFISAQSSIHTLRFYPSCRGSDHAGGINEPPASSVLPNLMSITADTHSTIALLPGRPISHVDIPVLSNEMERRFYECLRESSAPEGMYSMSMSQHRGGFWANFRSIIRSLKGVCGTSLRELTVRVMVPHNPHMKWVSWG
ncbi:hypothetical protein BDV93DRAFT_285504 [Ceratobasidium sp. AG-I]|nr:hypothetical protein BDV93DRAFT_285504 [Ceratobasidium sp. AG-I]